MKKIINIFTIFIAIIGLYIIHIPMFSILNKLLKSKLPKAVEFQVQSLEVLEKQNGVIDKNNVDHIDNLFNNDAHYDQKIDTITSTLHDNDIDNESVSLILSEYNLAVPFQSQAPFANWDMPYQEACEEACLIMVDAFFNNHDLSAEIMDVKIRELIDWQIHEFGEHKNISSKKVITIAQDYFNLFAKPDYDVSVKNIKKILSQNKLIIVPTAGRILPNPYFTGKGPLYHMLVIRGYTDKYFITNDPGTKRGKEFLYKYNDLIKAIHDWPIKCSKYKNTDSECDILTGEKVMIIVDK